MTRRLFPSMPSANTRLLYALLVVLALAFVLSPRRGWADGRGSVSVTSASDILLTNGNSQTALTATVRDADGNLVANGTSVQFATSLGTLDRESVTTLSGTARVTLTSAQTDGTAVVTVTAFVSGRAATGTTAVQFSSDHDLVSSTGDARWVEIECPQGLQYSADSKFIQVYGRNGSVHLRYRDIEIDADRLQLDLNFPSLPIIAHNAKMTRGHYSVVAADLSFRLAEGAGFGAIAPTGHYALISGPALSRVPMGQDAVDGAVKENPFHFEDISASHVIVSARSISIDPQNELQFRRAGIYSDGKRVVSVPYHVMSLTSKELFGQQLVGFNSEGFMVNVPIYYQVSPHSLGTLFVRNAAASGANPNDALPGSLANFGQYGSHTGVTLDLVHSYSFGQGRGGSLSLSGLTRSDRTAQWSHNQRVNDTTAANVSMSYTAGRSSFLNYGLNKDFKAFSLNLSASRDKDSGFDGYSFSGQSLQATINTRAHRVGRTGLSESTNFSLARNDSRSTTPQNGAQALVSSTRSVNMNFSMAPIRPDRSMTLTPSFKIGESWNDRGRNSLTADGTMMLNRTHFAGGNLSMGYFWTYDPLRSQSATGYTDPLSALYGSAFQQRMTVNYFATLHKRLSVNLNGFYGLTVHSSNLTTGLQYHLSNDLALGVTAFSSQYGQFGYNETQLSIQRRILGRLVLFNYSTKTKKIHFDIAAPNF